MGLDQFFKRLKWGILPKERIVENAPDDLNSVDDLADKTDLDLKQDADRNLDNEVSASDKETVSLKKREESYSGNVQLEIRDESTRPWWKFFDEYEYRSNFSTRSNHKWYKWFNETDTREEKILILKLDLCLALFSMAAYWVKYLGQTNISNVYVAGMKESIGMQGNDLVQTQMMFNVGNIVFQIPLMYALYALPTSYLMPGLELCWSILTIVQYRITNPQGLKVMRFFIGAFEAPSYVAYQWLFGSWYKADEMARRSMIFYFGQYLGILTSGLLSGAIVRGLEGYNGLQSWQWIFIIDGILALVVGVVGFYLLPGTPSNCYSIFLTDDEIRLARVRMKDNKTDGNILENPMNDFFKWDTWKPIFSSWKIYVLMVWCTLMWNNTNGTSGSYILWLQSLGIYSDGEVQDYSALTPGLGLLWLILICCWADLFHSRWLAILISQALNLLGNLILAVWNVPMGAKWFAWCLQYFGWSMFPPCYSWANDILRRDKRQRTVILISMNLLAQSTTAWISILVWKTSDAPRFLKGFSFASASSVAAAAWTFLVLYFYKRQERGYALDNGIRIVNANKSLA